MKLLLLLTAHLLVMCAPAMINPFSIAAMNDCDLANYIEALDKERAERRKAKHMAQDKQAAQQEDGIVEEINKWKDSPFKINDVPMIDISKLADVKATEPSSGGDAKSAEEKAIYDKKKHIEVLKSLVERVNKIKKEKNSIKSDDKNKDANLANSINNTTNEKSQINSPFSIKGQAVNAEKINSPENKTPFVVAEPKISTSQPALPFVIPEKKSEVNFDEKISASIKEKNKADEKDNGNIIKESDIDLRVSSKVDVVRRPSTIIETKPQSVPAASLNIITESKAEIPGPVVQKTNTETRPKVDTKPEVEAKPKNQVEPQPVIVLHDKSTITPAANADKQFNKDDKADEAAKPTATTTQPIDIAKIDNIEKVINKPIPILSEKPLIDVVTNNAKPQITSAINVERKADIPPILHNDVKAEAQKPQKIELKENALPVESPNKIHVPLVASEKISNPEQNTTTDNRGPIKGEAAFNLQKSASSGLKTSASSNSGSFTWNNATASQGATTAGARRGWATSHSDNYGLTAANPVHNGHAHLPSGQLTSEAAIRFEAKEIQANSS